MIEEEPEPQWHNLLERKSLDDWSCKEKRVKLVDEGDERLLFNAQKPRSLKGVCLDLAI